MNIYDEFHSVYPELSFAAMNVSDEEVKAKIESTMSRYASMWESGRSLFVSPWDFGQPSQRKPEDEQKEFAQLLAWTADSIWKLIIEAWVKKLSRDQLIQTLNAVVTLDPKARISICKTHSATPALIVNIWNKVHPEERINLIPGFEK